MSDKPKYVSPHPLPEGELRELLVILAEEAAEIVVAASKALRFGLADGYPGAKTTNADDITREVGQLLAVATALRNHTSVRPKTPMLCGASALSAAREEKHAKLQQFMQST